MNQRTIRMPKKHNIIPAPIDDNSVGCDSEEEFGPFIVANQVRLPSGKVIRSFHQHDYVSVIEDGVTYMVDGGEAYCRRSVTGENWSVYSDDPFKEIRKFMVWGTRGLDGRQPLKWIILKNMTEKHIRAVLDTQHKIANWKREAMEQELEYRKNRISKRKKNV